MELIKNSWLMKIGLVVLLAGLAIVGIGFANDAIVPKESDLKIVEGRLKDVRLDADKGASDLTAKDTLVVTDRSGKDAEFKLLSRLVRGADFRRLVGQTITIGHDRNEVYKVDVLGRSVVTHKAIADIASAGNGLVSMAGYILGGLGLLLTLIGIPMARRKIARAGG